MANTAPLVETNLEDVFLPQEHALISYYLLRPTPKGTPSIHEVTGYYSQEKWRESTSIYIAHIATGGSWDTVRDRIVCNIPKYRPPISNRNILFMRQVLFSVVWEDYAWDENGTEPLMLTYLVTYLPYYHIYVVVQTSDNDANYKLLLGYFEGDKQIRRNSLNIIRNDWRDRFKDRGATRWTQCYQAGLVSMQQANRSADCVWREG